MEEKAVAFLGATGAVGSEALRTLLSIPQVRKISTFGRSKIPSISDTRVSQHRIDISAPEEYAGLINNHDIAICTLGVGQPSKVSKDDFVKIDKTAVLNFAKICKEAGVKHFELLASVGISSKSRSFYLRIKGELVDELRALNFERLSIFMPSMIITPNNRYGFSQATLLFIWPLINPLLLGTLKKYRGVKVEILGEAMANNIMIERKGYEELLWEDFQEIKSA